MSNFEFAHKPSRRLWILSAVGALAIHAGCVAFALAHMQSDKSEQDLGAPAIEIGLELSSPRTEVSDLPPGPDTEASAASPAVTEQKAVVKETELPTAVPTNPRSPTGWCRPTIHISRRTTIPTSQPSRRLRRPKRCFGSDRDADR